MCVHHATAPNAGPTYVNSTCSAGPETDQQRRRDAHEFEEQAERQHEAEARARKQREIRADDRGHRAAGADDRRARAGQRQRADEIRQRAAEHEQREEAAKAERALGRDAEHDQEQQIAGQVQPVRVDEERGDQPRRAQLGQLLQPRRVRIEQRRGHRAPARDDRQSLGHRHRRQPQEHDHARGDDQQRRPRRPRFRRLSSWTNIESALGEIGARVRRSGQSHAHT